MKRTARKLHKVPEKTVLTLRFLDARRRFKRAAPKGVYLRLDQDLLDWLKHQGPGYQTRINAILRSYMETHKPGR